MFQFPRCPRTRLCVQRAVTPLHRSRVAPFGDPRISSLASSPRRFVGLPRPSSASVAKASTVRLPSLGPYPLLPSHQRESGGGASRRYPNEPHRDTGPGIIARRFRHEAQVVRVCSPSPLTLTSGRLARGPARQSPPAPHGDGPMLHRLLRALQLVSFPSSPRMRLVSPLGHRHPPSSAMKMHVNRPNLKDKQTARLRGPHGQHSTSVAATVSARRMPVRSRCIASSAHHRWGIVDSNHRPRSYQDRALTT